MKTCLSDDHPVVSLLMGMLWAGVGTLHLYFWSNEFYAGFRWTWIYLLFALAQYCLAVHFLRNGVSYRSEWALKLLEPRW